MNDWDWQLSVFDEKTENLRAAITLTKEQAAILLAIIPHDPSEPGGEFELDRNVFIGAVQSRQGALP